MILSSHLLAGKKIDMPPLGQVNVTFKQTGKLQNAEGSQTELDISKIVYQNLNSRYLL